MGDFREMMPAETYPAMATIRGGTLSRRTWPERLHDERQQLASRLKEVDEAIAALESNPEIERVIHLLTKVSL